MRISSHSLLSPWKLYTRPAVCRRHHRRLLRQSSTYVRPLDFHAIDEKWHQVWNDPSKWKPQAPDKGKYYVLPMFAYPSGALHIGHLRVYTISDVLARYRRMSGHEVLHPAGWDAFGLPAENAAIERGVSPAAWTYDNISKMREQLMSMGGCWNWDRELMTCDPEFYVDTQRIFLRLFEQGLAYQREALVNYDPIDRTVLANEQVDSNGFSWRSGAKVEKISLKQWYFRITAFKESLLHDLDELEKTGRWPERVVSMQRNWLGLSEGAEIDFEVSILDSGTRKIQVFTTRPDTLGGVQYLALSLDHPVVQDLATRSKSLQDSLDIAREAGLDSKVGVILPGVEAKNPWKDLGLEFPAWTESPLPVFAAPYVLSEYGTGAVMGVPAHDKRDFAFWKQVANDQPICKVVQPIEPEPDFEKKDEPFIELGILNNSCSKYSGLPSKKAGKSIVDDLAGENQSARSFQTWRLRDWLISRQRYWGTPIPIIHCESCGAIPVPEDELPVELPKIPSGELRGKGGNPLEHELEWVNTDCPSCKRPAKRETDTMDTFVDSSWYYLRFAKDAETGIPKFMPVDIYVGGVEHAILHLLYARFIAKFLATTSMWTHENSTDSVVEPFQRLLTQGMVHGKTFSDPESGRFLKPEELDWSDAQHPIIKATSKEPSISFEKMSKSKYNGVDPAECMRKYGADVTRAHLLFQAPVSEVLDWDEAKIVGIQRWFARIWQITNDLAARSPAIEDSPSEPASKDMSFENVSEAALWKAVQDTIASVTQSLSSTFTLNTVISDLMTLTNTLHSSIRDDSIETSPTGKLTVHRSATTLLRLLAPVAPSFVEECWEILHSTDPKQSELTNTAYRAGFPEPDGTVDRLLAKSQNCAVQINGKLKFATTIEKPPEGLKGEPLNEWVLRRVLETKQGADFFRSGKHRVKDARKIIVVRGGKVVNLVY